MKKCRKGQLSALLKLFHFPRFYGLAFLNALFPVFISCNVNDKNCSYGNLNTEMLEKFFQLITLKLCSISYVANVPSNELLSL